MIYKFDDKSLPSSCMVHRTYNAVLGHFNHPDEIPEITISLLPSRETYEIETLCSPKFEPFLYQLLIRSPIYVRHIVVDSMEKYVLPQNKTKTFPECVQESLKEYYQEFINDYDIEGKREEDYHIMTTFSRDNYINKHLVKNRDVVDPDKDEFTKKWMPLYCKQQKELPTRGK